MLDFRDFMLDFKKIASNIQLKLAILSEIEILVGNLRQKSRKIATEIQRKISYYQVTEKSELKSDIIEIGH